MANLPVHNPRSVLEEDDESIDEVELVQVLNEYKTQGEEARRSGPNPRDLVWEENWDRYWGRYDHSGKMEWQSKHVMPEVPQFVDRWAAAMREALDSSSDWFTAVDETLQSNELTQIVNRVMKIVLSRCGVSPDGHRVDFSSVFEDQMKQGAITACCAAVTWKEDENGGWPAVDTVDPREVWKDPKGRDLYRVRTYYVDKHELVDMADLEDDEGEPIYDQEKIQQLQAAAYEGDRKAEKERSTGQGEGEDSGGRKTVKIDEWLATVVSKDGNVVAANSLIVVANDLYVIRGPETNPFWHAEDWIVLTPMVTVPGAIYGKSYMEDWAEVADAFVEMTNLLLDSAYTSALRSFAMQPDALKDPRQLTEGFTPNVIYMLEEGIRPQDFFKEVETGTIPMEAVRMWEALKNEMREGAKLNEIALGQMPNNPHHTATAVNQTTQSSSSIIRSMARTIETRFLEIVLTQLWQVTLQHMDFNALRNELGAETAQMLEARRDEFAGRRIKFRVRGISGLIDRQSKMQNLMNLLQILGQSEPLMRELFTETTPATMLRTLFRLSGFDPAEIEPTERERMMQQAREEAEARMQQQMAQAQAQGQGQGRQPGGGQGGSR